jgi:hypothetical protein
MKWSDRLTESIPVRFSEIEDAFLFVSSGRAGECRGVLCRTSGKIYLHSDLAGVDEFAELEDERPDDLDDEKYIDIPDKRELNLGDRLVFDFVGQVLPGDLEQVRRMFRRRGAYGRFRAFLAERDVLERWYAFESAATERALREWCRLNSIALIH